MRPALRTWRSRDTASGPTPGTPVYRLLVGRGEGTFRHIIENIVRDQLWRGQPQEELLSLWRRVWVRGRVSLGGGDGILCPS